MKTHKDTPYASLASWVKKQRRTYQTRLYNTATGEKKKGEKAMTLSEMQKLEAIGFNFVLKHTGDAPTSLEEIIERGSAKKQYKSFDDWYKELEQFKAEYGHANPTRSEHKDYTKLAQWVINRKSCSFALSYGGCVFSLVYRWSF